MKKKLVLLLALVFVFTVVGTVLAACSTGLSDEQLTALIGEVRSYHKDDATITNTNFGVIGKVSTTLADGKEVEANVSWAASSDKISISAEMSTTGFFQVTIPDRSTLTEDLSYTLTATLVDADGNAYENSEGNTYSVSFNRKVEKSGASYAILTLDMVTKATGETEYTDSYGNKGWEKVTWTENDVTLVSVRGESTSGSNSSNVNPARFYKSSTIEVSYVVPIKAIKLTLDDRYNGQYLPGFDGMEVEGAKIDRSGAIVVIELETPATKFISGPLAAQTRIYTVEVYTDTVPELPEKEPEDDTRYETEAEIIAALKKLESGKTLSGGEYSLTGVITKIDTPYDDGYKNITVTIAVGEEAFAIQCFRMKGDGAADLKVNDKITVTGTLKNYNGTIEFDSGCTFVLVTSATPENPDTPHACASKCATCQKCTNKDCQETACADKCQGHGSTEPDPAPHACTSKCTTCQKCTNKDCKETACADKCQGHENTAEKGTEDNPFTAAEASAAASALEVNTYSDYCYVTGIVSRVTFTGSTYSFYIVDQGSSLEFYAYYIYLGTNIPAPAQHDTVTIYGLLTLYQKSGSTDTTPEITSNGTNQKATLTKNQRGTSSITLGAHGDATVSNLPNQGTNGDTITFTVQVPQGYQINSVLAEGKLATKGENGSYSFVLAGDTEITISTSEIPETQPAEVTFTFSSSDGYTNGASLSGTDVSKDGVTISFAKGTGSSDPAWYSSGNALRMYYKNTMSFSCSVNILKIEITFASSNDGDLEIVADSGEFATNVWTGNSDSVTLTFGPEATKGQRRIVSVKITLDVED